MREKLYRWIPENDRTKGREDVNIVEASAADVVAWLREHVPGVWEYTAYNESPAGVEGSGRYLVVPIPILIDGIEDGWPVLPSGVGVASDHLEDRE